MSDTRRGFLAFLGGGTVTGLVSRRASGSVPTLILPETGLVEAPLPSPAGYPLLEAKGSGMHALIEIRRHVPDELFFDWLEGGLRIAESCKPGGGVYRVLALEGCLAELPGRIGV